MRTASPRPPVNHSHSRQGRDSHRRRLLLERLEHRNLLATVTLTPTKDTTLFEDQAGTVSSGAGDSISIGFDHYSQTAMRGLMAFDVAKAIPTGSTINSVSLSVWLNYSYPRNTTPTVELHEVLADWGEAGSGPDPNNWMPPYGPAQAGDATWLHAFYPNSNWTTPGGDFDNIASGTLTLGPGNGAYAWASTTQLVSDVQNWLNNPQSNFGWLLKGDETRVSGKMIDSSESATSSHWPALTIDFTPPTTAPSLAIAATDATKSEGNAGSTPFTFTITRSGDVAGASSVAYAVTGSGANAASANDFSGGLLPSGTVQFAANETSKVVTINVAGDTTVESDEGLTITLSAPTGATIATAAANGTIRNDDGQATGITLTDGILTIVGTNDKDTVAISLEDRRRLRVDASFLRGDGGNDQDDENDDDDSDDDNEGQQFFDVSSVKRIEMSLLDGNDVVEVSSAVRIPCLIDGGGGNDKIRGGEGDDVLLGGAGNDRLYGMGGQNILVGGDGDDMAIAGSGRSILIGGNGRDMLYGSRRDDILIGGRTSHDDDAVALLAILAEWSSDQPIDTRISNLTTGVGPTGQYRLKVGESIFDDAVQDELIGGAGSDWFLVSATDVVKDRGRNDR